MKLTSFLFSALAAAVTASPILDVRAPTDLPRLAIYFQTTHDGNGNPISMLPLINEQGIALTHLIVCSIHLSATDEPHLNDKPPGDDSFKTLWEEAGKLKDSGVKIMGMVGGAAAGSFAGDTLDGDDGTFENSYGQLKGIIDTYGLQGMDLDVEQQMSQEGIARLVSRLRSDYGPDFEVTLTPVASALSGGANLSGFDYKALKDSNGGDISFYNTQFYSGFGDMASPGGFEAIVNNGFDPKQIVAGQLTAPENGNGYIPEDQLRGTIQSLRDEYGQIGGIMGWEYFNSAPGGTGQPWQWAQIATEILRPDGTFTVKITKEDAARLQKIYSESVKASGKASPAAKTKPKVDYFAMVNA